MTKTIIILSYRYLKKGALTLIRAPFYALFWLIFFYHLRKSRIKRRNIIKPRLLFGPDPIISNKYWSNALLIMGYKASTVMTNYYGSINNKEDYNYYVNEFFNQSSLLFKFLKNFSLLEPSVFIWSINNFDIFHIPCHGFLLRKTFLKHFEFQILRYAGVKVVVKPYGSDFYRYSKVKDPILVHALLKSYPDAANNEEKIEKNFNYWSKYADLIVTGIQLDGTGRWDVLPVSIVCIDLDLWKSKSLHSEANGHNGCVYITHTPNHKGFKGTEFIEQAVNELKTEGLDIKLNLVQGKKNDEVREILNKHTDILVEQIIAPGYALSAIEGMATGLPVISNLTNHEYLNVFKKYSYLNECPIWPANIDNIKDQLRVLITNPALRKKLGEQGRVYVEKYHSYYAYATLMEKVYQRIWYGKDVNLIDFYHPLNPDSYNNTYKKLA